MLAGTNHIPGTADRLRRCQLSSPVSVVNFWRSAAMLITSTVETCIQQLGRVEETVFTARRSYASAVLGVLILSVCHTRALWLMQRTHRRHFYTTWKGNPSNQMWFFIQLCSSWQDFIWLKASRGLSAIAELLVWLPGCFRSVPVPAITRLVPLFTVSSYSMAQWRRHYIPRLPGRQG